MKQNILLFSRDPGAANSIIPLLKALEEKQYYVRLFGKDTAIHRYTERGLKFLNIMDFVKNIQLDEIHAFLTKERPDFIITGTSGIDFTEKYLWKSAENIGIPTFAILDQWMNYGVRFSSYTVSDLEDYKNKKLLNYLPTKILVMDEFAMQEAIQEGLECSRILVTGNPHFEYLAEKAQKIPVDKIRELRNEYGLLEKDFLVTYASEPVYQQYKNFWGYTEKSIFKKIYDGLIEQSVDFKGSIKIIIKLHPREDSESYSEIINTCNDGKISVFIDQYSHSYDLIMSSNLVSGMSSMFLIESVLLRKPVISVQIGLKTENPFILDRRGIVKSILDESTLNKELKLFLSANGSPNYAFYVKENPVHNIILEMEKYICPN